MKTTDQYIADPAHCPVCGSSEINAEVPQPSGSDLRLITVRVSCEGCGATWEEHYTLTGFKFSLSGFEPKED